VKGIDGYYPSVTLDKYQIVSMNFGSRPFLFNPPNVKSMQSIYDVPKLFISNFPLIKMTPLHWCAATNNVNDLSLLLKHAKFDLNAQAKSNGKTPLGLAIQSNSLVCVKLLLEAGADPNAIDTGRKRKKERKREREREKRKRERRERERERQRDRETERQRKRKKDSIFSYFSYYLL